MAKCRPVSSYASCKKITKESRRCLICLKTGYLSNQALSKISYFKCCKKYHAVICSGLGKSASLNQGGQKDTKEMAGKDNAIALLNSFNNISRNKIFQTAFVKAENHEWRKCFVLFDSSSQLSYILSELCHKFHLKPKYYKNISIHFFGNKSFAEHLAVVEKEWETSIHCFIKEIFTPLRN